jgi:hypothetical protein
MVVVQRDPLHHNMCSRESQHRRLPRAHLRPALAPPHSLGSHVRGRGLQHLLHIPDHLPMPSRVLLLDTVRRGVGLVHRVCRHRRLNIRTRRNKHMVRFYTLHTPHCPRLEPEHEPPDQDLSSSDPVPRRTVPLPSPSSCTRTNNPTSGSIATIVRIPYIYQLAQTSDFLYANIDVAIWSTVEPGLGMTAAAMACLRPLVQAFLSSSRLLGSSKPATATAAT